MSSSDGGGSGPAHHGDARTVYRRFEFVSYEGTSDFLDRLADLSERLDFYPNVDFGSTYVRVAIEADDQIRLVELRSPFVEEMEQLAQAGPGSSPSQGDGDAGGGGDSTSRGPSASREDGADAR